MEKQMDKDDENKPKTKRGKRTYTTTLIGAKEYNTEKIQAVISNFNKPDNLLSGKQSLNISKKVRKKNNIHNN